MSQEDFPPKPIALPTDWPYYLETALLVLLLIFCGLIHFSHIDPTQRRRIELEAGLEQLYHVEQAHAYEHGRYFNPADSSMGLHWQWMEDFEWECRVLADGFWVVAVADLDGDGEKGIWYIDESRLEVRLLNED
ncbi:MAG: hypothetical protein GKR89_08415 [Candidatus Latescibacteria bacterium]|nr:hypothetical protein [Candidatus Latescibacterota bacterium]